MKKGNMLLWRKRTEEAVQVGAGHFAAIPRWDIQNEKHLQ